MSNMSRDRAVGLQEFVVEYFEDGRGKDARMERLYCLLGFFRALDPNQLEPNFREWQYRISA